MENPIKMDDLGGKPTIFGNIHVYVLAFACLQCQNLAQDVGKDKEGSYEASNAAEVAASSWYVFWKSETYYFMPFV